MSHSRDADAEDCLPAHLRWAGCCNGTIPEYCSDSTGIEQAICEPGETCGWDPASLSYGCMPAFAEDPSGMTPSDCSSPCSPSCEGRTCGSDGCGGSCGSCLPGSLCEAGSCKHDNCAGVNLDKGCCTGNVARTCTGPKVIARDCELTGDLCGWDATTSTYGCGGSSASDPTGTVPMACDCVPDCTGKACGNDGCGGACGFCGIGNFCNTQSQCEADPDPCGAVQYGSGCCDGHTLRRCASGVEQAVDCSAFGKFCSWNPFAATYDCTVLDNGADPTGEFAKACLGACAPNCVGKQCGSDGCGGQCGTCPDGGTCNADGSCEECVPECSGKACGPDGCGGTCGECVAGHACNDAVGQCECVPTCGGTTCGSDGCGGTCPCASGSACDLATHTCLALPERCADVGVTPAGCCGSGNTVSRCAGGAVQTVDCGAGQYCAWLPSASSYGCTDLLGVPLQEPSGLVPRQCPCIPACDGRACGPDGCGGTCGACAVGATCDAEGQCEVEECPGIPNTGCCSPGNIATYCENGRLVARDCFETGSYCGWNPVNPAQGSYPKGYRCGESQSFEPTGAIPPKCPACTPSCAGRTCGGDGCGGSCGACADDQVCMPGGFCAPDGGCDGVPVLGCCDGDLARACVDGKPVFESCGNAGCGWAGHIGELRYDCGHEGYLEPTGTVPRECPDLACQPDCTGRTCGTDGCGGSCGECAAGQACGDGVCVSDLCTSLPKGCCDGDALVHCPPGETRPVAFDCSSLGASFACGLRGTEAACAPEELLTPNAPAWTTCPDELCVPACDGKACGPDGCGAQCGRCTDGLACDAAGHCVEPCKPSCANRTCGGDGCGGSCGTCGSGDVCYEPGDGRSYCLDEDPCDGIPSTAGCCDGNTLKRCAGGATQSIDCAATGQVCGWSEGPPWTTTAAYACVALSSGGADPSGATPQACPGTDACAPQCDGRTCGPDGCGGTCGSCGTPGDVCNPETGQCVACEGVPFEGCCLGGTLKRCGDSSGSALVYTFECGGCGWSDTAGNGGGAYRCGTDGGVDPTGDHPKACACTPVCDGRQCGSDGCYGTCGTCPDGFQCVDDVGKCVHSSVACGSVTWEGTCDGDTVQYCASGTLVERSCTDEEAPHCGWSDAGQVYACGTPGQGEPTGTLPKAAPGTQETCVPNCAGRQCGSDGCGGSCGSCAVGAVCSTGADAGQCVPPVADPTHGVPPGVGCCVGDVLYKTEAGPYGPEAQPPLDCAASGLTCGWIEHSGGTGYDCTGAGTEDPSGTHVRACPSDAPACDAATNGPCSFDGLGQACGVCGGSTRCDYATGQCRVTNEGTCDRAFHGPTVTYDEKCGHFYDGWECQCDTHCLVRGDCCADFDALCSSLFVPNCGDGDCNAVQKENCATCAKDCGACQTASGLAPPWASPFAQVIALPGTPQARNVDAVDPLDHVLPMGPPLPLEGLLAYVPDLAAKNVASKATWVGRGMATPGGFVNASTGVQGDSIFFGGLQSTGGTLRIRPEHSLPARPSFATHAAGGFTLSFWMSVAAQAPDGVTPVLQTLGVGYGKDETCAWSRPEDSAAWIECESGQVIADVQAYYGSFTSEAYPHDGDCSRLEQLRPTYACHYEGAQAAVESACLGKNSCRPDLWAEAKDPCGQAPTYLPNTSKLIVRAVCAYPSELAEPWGARMVVDDAVGNRRLRYELPGVATLSSQQGLKDGKWHQVTLTFHPLDTQLASGVTSLYIDGELDDATDAARSPEIRELVFGAIRAGDGAGWTPGAWALDEVFVFDRALSQSEIRSLVRKPGTGLLRAWPPITAAQVVSTGEGIASGTPGLASVEASHLIGVEGLLLGDEEPLRSPLQGLSLPVGTRYQRPMGDDGALDGIEKGFTLMGWIRPTDLTSGKPLLDFVDGDGAPRLGLDVGDACAGRVLRGFTAGDSVVGGGLDGCDHVLGSGRWSFVAMVYRGDGKPQSVYLDGYEVGTSVGPAPSAVFVGHASWSFRTGDGVDLLWSAAFDRALTPDQLAAWRLPGPALWLDGAAWNPTANTTRVRDWAQFSNRTATGETDYAELRTRDDDPAMVEAAEGPLLLTETNDESPASIIVPARGRLRSNHGDVPAFSFSARIDWDGGYFLDTELVTLETTEPDAESGARETAFRSTLSCHRANLGPSAESSGELWCQVRLIGFSAVNVQVEWRSDWLGGTLPPGVPVAQPVSLEVALRYGRGETPSLAFSFPDVALVPTHEQEAGHLPLPDGVVPLLGPSEVSTAYVGASGIPLASEDLQFRVGGVAQESDTGAAFSSARLYTRRLSDIELERLVKSSCNTLGCEGGGKECTEAPSASVLPVCAVCGAGYYEASSALGGECTAKRAFGAVCQANATCGSGACQGGTCAAVGETGRELCESSCVERGRDCISVGALPSGDAAWACSTECAEYYDPPSKDDPTAPCVWNPTSALGASCMSDAQCLSGSCTDLQDEHYHIGVVWQPDCSADGKCPKWIHPTRNDLFLCGEQAPYASGFFEGGQCAPYSTASTTVSVIGRCNATTADECVAEHRQPILKKGGSLYGADYVSCNQCEQRTVLDAATGTQRPLWVKGWSLMSPFACSRMHANLVRAVWDASPGATWYALDKEPTLGLLGKYLLGKETPVQPADITKMMELGLGTVIVDYLRAKDEATRAEIRGRYASFNLSDCWKPTVTRRFGQFGEYAEWAGLDEADYSANDWEEIRTTLDAELKSPFIDPSINRLVCVANKFGNGTPCPPAGVEDAAPDQFCQSGFCARDTHVCEDGFGRIEQTEDAGRGDNQAPDDDSDLGPIALVQKNNTTLEVKKEKGESTTDAVKRRDYSLASTNTHVLSVFGAAGADVFSSNMKLIVHPDDEEAEFDSTVQIMGITVPDASEPASSCGGDTWDNGEYQKPEPGEPPCSLVPDAEKLMPEPPAFKLCYPIPGLECEEEEGDEDAPEPPPGTTTVAHGALCFEQTTFAGPIPITISASVGMEVCIGAGADVDEDTMEPGFKVVPEFDVGLDLHGGVGVAAGPVEAFAGVHAVITIVNLAFPIRWAMRVAEATDEDDQPVENLFKIEFFRTVKAELGVLQLVAGVFAEIGVSVFKVEWEQKLFEFGGFTFSWDLADDVLNSKKLDLEHFTADQ
ncbi:MAG: hypothetical protein IV100_07535 [Myxococcales bacterium]|nr:hypothetical protein [Myxococcales bacterium]